jgi:hypothetical protein
LPGLDVDLDLDLDLDVDAAGTDWILINVHL